MKQAVAITALTMVLALSSAAFAENYSFDDYTFFVRASFDVGLTGGDLIAQEQDSWELSVSYMNGNVMKDKPNVSQFSIEGEVEWKFKRIGIPLHYRFTMYSEEISVGDNDSYEKFMFEGKLMYLHSVSSGIHFYFGINDREELNQYGAWFIGVRLGLEYAYLIPYPTLLRALELQPLDAWGLIGLTGGPVIGYNYLFGNFLIGLSVQLNGHALWTPDALSDYYENMANFVLLGDVLAGVTVGLAF